MRTLKKSYFNIERVREVDKHLVEKNVEMIFAVGRHISTFRPKMKQNVETQFPNFDISSKNGVKRRMSAKCVRSTVYIMADSAIDRKALCRNVIEKFRSFISETNSV